MKIAEQLKRATKRVEDYGAENGCHVALALGGEGLTIRVSDADGRAGRVLVDFEDVEEAIELGTLPDAIEAFVSSVREAYVVKAS